MDFMVRGIAGVDARHVAFAALDILVVYYAVYRLLAATRGTRAQQALVGVGVVAAAFVLSRWMGLVTVHWALENLVSSALVLTVVVFQSDIRRALARLGRNPFAGAITTVNEAKFIDEVATAVSVLARERVGALIVIERSAKLDEWTGDAIRMDAVLSWELLRAVFQPGSPIHDGAVVLRRGRIHAAGVYLPLTENLSSARDMGTRHRSAVGISEVTDAFVIVVSEQTGAISFVIEGDITRAVETATLRQVMQAALGGVDAAARFEGRSRSARHRALSMPRMQAQPAGEGEMPSFPDVPPASR